MQIGQLFEPLSIGTNIAMGYPLEEALALLADIGVRHVELSSIAGMCEHVVPGRMDADYAEWVLALLARYGMTCTAVAGHVDLTEEDQLEDFLKKIEFAGRIGANYINTNTGPRSRIQVFQENLKRVVAQAENWNVTVCLESHGDIVRTARESAAWLSQLRHPLIRMNYDTGNTYFYEKGQIDVAEDLPWGEDVIAYMHLKDVRIRGNTVRYTPLGDGDLNFSGIFQKLAETGRRIPASLEIPVFVAGTLHEIGPQNPPLSKEEIAQAIRKSCRFLEERIQML